MQSRAERTGERRQAKQQVKQQHAESQGRQGRVQLSKVNRLGREKESSISPHLERLVSVEAISSRLDSVKNQNLLNVCTITNVLRAEGSLEGFGAPGFLLYISI
jgi:hypothetical protein